MPPVRKLKTAEYPSLLNEIPDPPKQLFVRGSLPHEHNLLLCVVGSRKYSEYGKSVCHHLITGLAHLPVTIVSGLAIGIDTIAHQSALESNLQTIAVPGSGIDPRVIYPTSNRDLSEQIIRAEGGLLSEYEPMFKATTWSFPRRNRIMAGLCHAILVIEAQEMSGTLITARLASEYNRDVLAVPGSIFSTYTTGPHCLIKDGATPITCLQDLQNALGFENQKVAKTYENCTPHERILISLLKTPKKREELNASGLSHDDINMALTLLDMKGYINEQYGKIYLC